MVEIEVGLMVAVGIILGITLEDEDNMTDGYLVHQVLVNRAPYLRLNYRIIQHGYQVRHRMEPRITHPSLSSTSRFLVNRSVTRSPGILRSRSMTRSRNRSQFGSQSTTWEMIRRDRERVARLSETVVV